MSHGIVIVDDEPAIRRLVRAALDRAGYAASEAATGAEGVTAARREGCELVLLDLGLPDRDGLELVPLVKATGAALVIVSARDATDQKVTALDLGADDYVTKPFDAEEVLARVRTALRHRLQLEAEAPTVRFGEVEIDLVARLVRKSGEEVHLTPKEFGFLAELAKHPGRVVTHAQLLRSVWGPGHEQDVEYLRVTARGVRRKLEDDPARPSAIRNEPGVGYRLMA